MTDPRPRLTMATALPGTRGELAARFWAKVAKSDGCWLWTASRRGKGYGAISVDGKLRIAHRFSYEMHCGPIPDGMFVCHRCDVPACVNPDHLFLGTVRDNTADKMAKGRYRQVPLIGESNGRTKLTAEAVVAIRTSGLSLRKAAVEFGVSPRQIWAIRRREIWRHI